MEEIVKNKLRNGEKILWKSGPKKFPLLEKGTRFIILRLWVITVALVSCLVGGYVTQNENWNPELAIGIIVLGLLVISSPIIERVRVSKERYFMTNQRVFLVMSAKTVYEMELSAIDAVKVVDDLTEHTCIAMGSGLFESMRKEMRWRACHPLMGVQDTEHRGRVDGIVFYDVEDAAGAMAILNKRNQEMAA